MTERRQDQLQCRCGVEGGARHGDSQICSFIPTLIKGVGVGGVGGGGGGGLFEGGRFFNSFI